MRLRPVWQLTQARLRELRREPGTMFWAFGFPILMTAGLGLAFSRTPSTQTIGVLETTPAPVVAALRAGPFQVEIVDPAVARARLRAGRIALLVGSEPDAGPNALAFTFDARRPEARAARDAVDAVVQRAAGRRDPVPTRDRLVVEPGARYVDFLVPGLIGLNVMSGSLWAIGWAIVNLRVRGLMKRLLAAPVARTDVLAALVLARLIILPFEMAALLIFARVAFGVPVNGSLALIALLCLTGCLSFAGIAVFIASRARNIETITGLINAVAIPLLVASGVFFPASRFPEALQPLVALLPLAALNDALRAVILDGAGLPAVAPALAILAAWGTATFAVGLRRFRWI